MAASLNCKQSQALKFVASGHNLVLLGKAGTGKSYTVMKIVESCKSDGKTCAVTATTGIASSVYATARHVESMTIHRWSGICDGRYGPCEIKNIVSNNVKYRHIKDRILQTDTLIIDEFSMMSKRTLECVNAVCSLKNPDLLFGGIQVILVGDPLQLPPVPCARYGDDGSFCFESELFTKAFPHRISLDCIHRQTDLQLIKAVKESSLGVLSEETCAFLTELQRPFICNTEIEPIRLFSTNDLVDDFNRQKILQCPGAVSEFVSVDKGEKKYFGEVQASRKLWLKIGIPVILIKNLSDRLVNGLRGTVYSIEDNVKVLVEFPNMKEKVYIKREKFEVFDPQRNCVVASREQIPLKPAFAITIHKSQGMTLERVEIDCRQIFRAGQLGVAIGRVRSKDDLRVVNFKRSVCRKQPEKVIKFWGEDDCIEVAENRDCCNGQERDNAVDVVLMKVDEEDPIHNDDQQPDFEDFDNEFDNLLSTLDEDGKDITLPESLSVKDIIESVKSETVLTSNQLENNSIISRIRPMKMECFVKQQYLKLGSLINKCDSKQSGQIVSKDLGKFYTESHSYLVSADFKIHCLKLFDTEEKYTQIHQRICSSIFAKVREYIINAKAEEVEDTNRQINKRTITHASRARIRYIGGYSVAKVKHKYIMKKNATRYSQKQQDKQDYENAKCAVDILQSLTEDEQHVIETTDEPDSLLDISRRQNLNRGLTNIPDTVFQFFIKLTEMCLTLLVCENLNKMGSNMFNECRRILDTSALYMEFVKLCSYREDSSSDFGDDSVEKVVELLTLKVAMIKEVYHKIIKYHLMVMFNQFRKDTIDSLNITKQMAHRKQVRVSLGEKCDQKDRKAKKQSDSGSSSSVHEISLLEPQHDTSVLESQPSTSRAIEPVAGEIQEQSSCTDLDTDEIKCKVCDTIDKQSLWIQCDSCQSWLHRNCAGLKHHLKWKKYQKKTAKFHCKDCE